MAHYVTTVRSPRTPEDVFAFMADLRNFALWDPGVKSSVQLGGDTPGLNAEYEVTVTGSRLVYRIVDFQPPRSLLAVAETPRLGSRDQITVEPDGEGSRCTYDATLALKGVFRIADPAMGLIFRRIGDRAAAGLARALDGSIVPA